MAHEPECPPSRVRVRSTTRRGPRVGTARPRTCGRRSTAGVGEALLDGCPPTWKPVARGLLRDDRHSPPVPRRRDPGRDGDHFETVYGDVAYPDQGLTIDAILAFAAAKVSDTAAEAATTWLAQSDIMTSYIGDGTDEAYAGATAKLALAVQVRGEDPTAFGGVDLIERLRGRGDTSGRFSDQSAYGDYSNAFSQSLSVLALERTAEGAPASAAAYLAASRCDDGGYPLYFETETCVSDVDATAMAVQALLAVDWDAEAMPGVTWLLAAQDEDGAFCGDSGTPNANSTGLSAQALRMAGQWGRGGRRGASC